MAGYTLYDFLPSGNGYKVRLLLKLLGIEYRLVEMDILKGETRKPEFLAKNPNGRIPLLELETGECLAESGAILNYLAEGTPFLPQDRLARAQVLQWMFFEQYSHEPFVAVARFIHEFEPKDSPRWLEVPTLHEKGKAALGVMEDRLSTASFLVGEGPTIADIALYAYSHVADEGGFDLSSFPGIRRWFQRIESLPGYAPLTHP